MPVYLPRAVAAISAPARRRAQPPHVTGAEFLQDASAFAPKLGRGLRADLRRFLGARAKAMAASAGSTAWRPRSRRCAPQRGDDRVLLLDGGDTWQGSLGANRTKGQDIVDCVKLLRPDAMTGHWEFTYGEERVKEADRAARLSVPRAQRSRHRMAGAGVRRLQDVRQGRREDRRARARRFAYTPVANPRWMMPNWTFGIREDDVRANVAKARKRRRAARRAALAQRLRLSTASSPRASPAST